MAHAHAPNRKAYGRNGKRSAPRRVPKAASALRSIAARPRPARAAAPPQGISHQGGNNAAQENDRGFCKTPKTKNVATCILSRNGRRDAAAAKGPAQSPGTQLRHKGTGCTRVPMATCLRIAPHEHACAPPLSYQFAQGVRGLQPAVLGRAARLIRTLQDMKCDENGEIVRYHTTLCERAITRSNCPRLSSTP